jgi:hypothetical protein
MKIGSRHSILSLFEQKRKLAASISQLLAKLQIIVIPVVMVILVIPAGTVG